jgi:hypothetical protein
LAATARHIRKNSHLAGQSQGITLATVNHKKEARSP